MAGNSRTTFAKRQKERARQAKQAEKMQRGAERNCSKQKRTTLLHLDLRKPGYYLR